MDLNKLMQFALEHQRDEELKKVHIHVVTELLSRTFIRITTPTQRENELAQSAQEIFNDWLEDEDEDTRELLLEIMGNAKNVIIDIADKMETDK